MRLSTEEIVGVWQGQTLVCAECADKGDWDSVESADNILTQSDIDRTDNLYFCDRCNKRL